MVVSFIGFSLLDIRFQYLAATLFFFFFNFKEFNLILLYLLVSIVANRKSVVFGFSDVLACQWLLVIGDGHVMWLPWLRGGWDVVWLLRVAS